MNPGRTVFAQLIEHLPHKEFHKCVARYRGDHYAKNFSCWDQYLAMAFAQLTYRESLRDIETCLGAVGASCTTWVFAAVWRVRRWPMPTSRATGASRPTSHRR
jgi:hypothetical protein